MTTSTNCNNSRERLAAKSDARIRIEERKKWKQIAMAGKAKARP